MAGESAIAGHPLPKGEGSHSTGSGQSFNRERADCDIAPPARRAQPFPAQRLTTAPHHRLGYLHGPLGKEGLEVAG